MKIISQRVHGILDYAVSALLIIMPYALHLTKDSYQTWVPVTAGIITICYSLLTDYEYGAVRIIPMQYHLVLDTASAILLIASPWLFHFANEVYMPHVVIGIAELAV